MEKIRVLQFPISANNGVKSYALNNWKFLDKSKFECDFVVVRPDLGFEEEFAKAGAGVKYLLSSAEREREQYISDLKKILLGNYDVVHLHTSYWKRLLIEEIAMECKIPKVIVHSNNTQIDIADEEKRKKAEEVHWKLRDEFDTSLATDFCACSQAAADWLFGPKIPQDQIKVLHNAIDVEKFMFNQTVRDRYRKLLGLENSFVIGHIGRFSTQKNHEFLIDVFYEVSKKVTNARLLLIGEGPHEKAVKEKVESLGLSDKVFFLGQRQDVSQLLQAIDVFCLPSKFEGLPIVLVEAVASGLPCLISDSITKEVTIFPNVFMINLNSSQWIDYLVNIARDTNRKNTYNFVIQMGYSIKHSVSELELFYSERVLNEPYYKNNYTKRLQ